MHRIHCHKAIYIIILPAVCSKLTDQGCSSAGSALYCSVHFLRSIPGRVKLFYFITFMCFVLDFIMFHFTLFSLIQTNIEVTLCCKSCMDNCSHP